MLPDRFLSFLNQIKALIPVYAGPFEETIWLVIAFFFSSFIVTSLVLFFAIELPHKISAAASRLAFFFAFGLTVLAYYYWQDPANASFFLLAGPMVFVLGAVLFVIRHIQTAKYRLVDSEVEDGLIYLKGSERTAKAKDWFAGRFNLEEGLIPPEAPKTDEQAFFGLAHRDSSLLWTQESLRKIRNRLLVLGGVAPAMVAAGLITVAMILTMPNATIEEDDGRTTITIPGHILFDTGKSEIRAGAQFDLQRAANRIAEDFPSVVHIEGHADSRGDEAENLVLSQKRADSVKAWFSTRPEGQVLVGIEMIATGYGETRLIESEAVEGAVDSNELNPLALQKNRRVEIWYEKGGSPE